MPLVELCLQIKLLSLGSIKLFLSMVICFFNQIIQMQFYIFCSTDFLTHFCLFKALEPPKDEAIMSAISLLYEVYSMEMNLSFGFLASTSACSIITTS